MPGIQDLIAQMQMQRLLELAHTDPLSTTRPPPSTREPLRKPDSFFPPQTFMERLVGGFPQVSDPLTGQPSEAGVQQALVEAITGSLGGGVVGSAVGQGARNIGQSVRNLFNPQVGSGVVSSGASVPRAATPGSILRNTKDQGGFSVNMATGEVPKEGFMVGAFPGKESVMDRLTKANLGKFTKTNRKVLENEDNFLGTWVDPNTGKTYIDVSKRFEDLRPAVKLGEKKNQLAIFDLAQMREIVGGKWDDWIQGPEFRSRLAQMHARGSTFMQNQTTRDWWDIRNTVWQDTYGRDNLQKVSGYLASTSPNNKVRQNIRDATEYIRRELRGEHVLQPDFRGPGGAKMSMEAGKKKNLTRVREGRFSEISEDKVQSMYRAQIGDPDAVVLDRHFARISEDPTALNPVFADRLPDRIPAGAPYQLTATQVRNAAKQAGSTPAVYSADVWAGIREEIKETGQLFGVPRTLKESAEGSASMADQMSTLLAERARDLGITAKEVMARLGNGDVSLLSFVLSTPLLSKLLVGNEDVRGTPDQPGRVPGV